MLAGCSNGPWLGRRTAGPAGSLDHASRQEPALSGQGRWLASVVERSRGATLLLQEQPSGRVVHLRHFQTHQPHSSPSLSWNGRYLAALVQQSGRPVPLIEDRLSGANHRIPLPADRTAVRLSLAPEADRLAIQVIQDGQSRIEVFDLAALLEADRPGGMAIQGTSPGAPP